MFQVTDKLVFFNRIRNHDDSRDIDIKSYMKIKLQDVTNVLYRGIYLINCSKMRVRNIKGRMKNRSTKYLSQIKTRVHYVVAY